MPIQDARSKQEMSYVWKSEKFTQKRKKINKSNIYTIIDMGFYLSRSAVRDGGTLIEVIHKLATLFLALAVLHLFVFNALKMNWGLCYMHMCF